MVTMSRETTKALDEAKARAPWSLALEALDKAAREAATAEARVAKSRENFSAKILEAVRVAPSAVAFLEGVAEKRATHASESGAYAQMSVALMRAKRAFRRVTGSDKQEDWSANFEAIRGAASEAANFTQFERGTPPEAKSDAETPAEATLRADVSESVARKALASLPEPPEESKLVALVWPEGAKARLTMFDRICGACVLDGLMTQAYADAIVALAREALGSALEMKAQGVVQVSGGAFVAIH